MPQNWLSLVAIILASFFSLLLNHLKISIIFFQQIIVLLMLVIFGLYKVFSKTTQRLVLLLFGSLIVFTITLITQLLILSSGGLLSPFLILMHLYTIGASFLLGIWAGLSFVVLTVAILLVQILTNLNDLNALKADPGTYLIYVASFIIIIPLSQFVSKKYHIQEELSGMLSKRLKIGDTILESLTNLVLVTDPSLKIIFINEAFKKNLDFGEGEILGRNIFEVLDIRNDKGQKVNADTLAISKALESKVAVSSSGLYLYTKTRSTPILVSIKIRPVLNANNKVDQLSFVITEGRDVSLQDNQHSDLIKAFEIQDRHFIALKDELKSKGLSNLASQLELINRAEKDLRLIQELEDHAIKESQGMTDVAFLADSAVLKEQSLANVLGVDLKFVLSSDDRRESAAISLRRSNINLGALAVSDYFVPIDEHWLTILIEKMLDLALLVSSTVKNSKTEVVLNRQNYDFIQLAVISDSQLTKEETKELLVKDYGQLAVRTNLRLGSGVEGYIVKILTTLLNLPFEIKIMGQPSKMYFLLNIPRTARNTDPIS